MAIAQGGPAKTAPYDLVAGLTVTEIFSWTWNTQSWTGSVTSPAVILKMKDSSTYQTSGPMYGVNNGTPLCPNGYLFAGSLSSWGFSFFDSIPSETPYGAGGAGIFAGQNAAAAAGHAGVQGAVRLWFYS